MSPCPTRASLELLLSGGLAPTEADALRTHAVDCSRCQAELDRLTDSAELRGWAQHARTNGEDGPALQQALHDLKAVSPSQSSADTVLDMARARPSFLEEPLEPGDLGALGPYRILAELGQGGMGLVYRAYDTSLQRTVAIKVLRPELASTPARKRLVREAQLVAGLRHDHLVGVYAVENPSGGLPYLVMEYLAGATLQQLLRTRGPLPGREAARILAQVAEGLDAAHQAGLVHRDVKPGNIMLDPVSGRAKLMDFGLARSGDLPSGLSREISLAGTPVYMSPEQAQGHEPLDARTDIYSLGVTLYEAIVGEPPFRGTSAMVFQQLLVDEPRRPRTLNPAIPRNLETICLKALAREPARRYATARQMADDLRRFLRGEPIHARPASLLERGWRWCLRNRRVSVLSAALLLVFVAGVAGITWQWAEAVQERRQAERDRDEAQRLRLLAEKNFRLAREAVDTYLTRISENPGLKAHAFEPLRRELLQTARDFYDRFVQEAPDDPNLRAELGRAYGRLALITTFLESSARSLPYDQKMTAVFEQLHAEQPDHLDYQDELAESWLQQGHAYRTMGKQTAALAADGRSRALREELVRAHPDMPRWRCQLARTLREMGCVHLFWDNDYGKAEEALGQARALYKSLTPPQRQAPARRFESGLVHLDLAKLYGLTERVAEKEKACAAAVAELAPLAHDHPDHPEYALYWADAMQEWGDAYQCAGKLDLAERALTESQRIAKDLVRLHPDTDYYRHAVADALYTRGQLLYHDLHRPADARKLFDQALAIDERLAERHPQVGEFGFNLYNLYRDLAHLFGDQKPVHDAIRRTVADIQHARIKGDTASLSALYQNLGSKVSLCRYARAPAQARQILAEAAAKGALPHAYEAVVWADQRQYARAADAAADMATGSHINGSDSYHAALTFAQLTDAVIHDRALPANKRQSLSARLGAQAVTLLRRAWLQHHFTAVSSRWLLTDDRRLDVLRDRRDFQALLLDVKSAERQRRTLRLAP